MKTMSAKYRLMIYFFHSTLVMYEKDIKSGDIMSPLIFRAMNQKVVDRVCEEAVNIFEYELSYEQVMKGCHTYLSAKYHTQSVEDSKAFTLEET